MDQAGVARARVIGRAALVAPVTGRARREALFALAGAPIGFSFLGIAFGGALAIATAAGPAPDSAAWTAIWAPVLVLLLLILALAAARSLGSVTRWVAAWLLGEQISEPPPLRTRQGLPARPGNQGWLAARFRDGPGWRATAYLLLKFPFAVFELYAVAWWAAGIADLTYPFWWGLMRNHPPGTHLSPVPVFTPFGLFGSGTFRVATFPGTFAAFAAGVGMVLAAPGSPGQSSAWTAGSSASCSGRGRWRSGCVTWSGPGPLRSTTPPRFSARWSGTCTTVHRSGWQHWR